MKAELTEVIVSGNGYGCPGAWALLGEMVSELDNAGIVLQHCSDFHLN